MSCDSMPLGSSFLLLTSLRQSMHSHRLLEHRYLLSAASIEPENTTYYTINLGNAETGQRRAITMHFTISISYSV